MELIVISDAGAVDDEAQIINALFSAGMQRFHFRKPDWDSGRCAAVMEKVDLRYRHAIALHQHHEQASALGIKGLHFSQEHREKTDHSRLMALKEEQNVLSTSLHALGERHSLSVFDYAFFSPVFDSISKPGYRGMAPGGLLLEKSPGPPRLFALGGICAANLADVNRMNFDGAAVLGSVWLDAEAAVDSFTHLKQRLEQINED